jgi:hypothetical protein
MTAPPRQWVTQRAQALIAWLNGEPDADAWLEATGLTRDHQIQISAGEWTPCPCPFCQRRPIEHRGDLAKLLTREPRNHLETGTR